MSNLRVTVEGLDKLQAALDFLPAQVRAGARKATEDAVESVEEDMKGGVPRSSSTLHDAIEGKVTGDLSGEVGIRDPRKVFWGAFQEFGTSQQPAQPFAEPAARAEEEVFPDRVRRGVKSELPR